MKETPIFYISVQIARVSTFSAYILSINIGITAFVNDVVKSSGITPWPDGSTGFQPRDETYTNVTGQRIILTTGEYNNDCQCYYCSFVS